MIAFPTGVRLAVKGDERRVYDAFVVAHAENGFGDVDEKEVRANIAKACATAEGFVIAIIDGPERIEGVLGLRLNKLWYNSAENPANWFWHELIYWVHPLHRRSRHAAKLLKFGQWWGEQTKQRVVIELLPRDDLVEKEKLLSRFGSRIGGAFLVSAAPT
jgi:hypothetical protein